jgi:hypothetical protein
MGMLCHLQRRPARASTIRHHFPSTIICIIRNSVWVAFSQFPIVRVGLIFYLEQALQTMIGPFETIERASDLISERTIDLNEISEQIKVIADAVVDAWRTRPAEWSRAAAHSACRGNGAVGVDFVGRAGAAKIVLDGPADRRLAISPGTSMEPTVTVAGTRFETVTSRRLPAKRYRPSKPRCAAALGTRRSRGLNHL